MSQVVAIATAIFVLALGVTKLVDTVRNFFAAHVTWVPPRYVWNVLSFALGLAYTLGWGVDLVGSAIGLIPALAGKSLSPVVGQVVTGLAIGAGAGFWHEVLDALSGLASSQHAKAGPAPR